MNDGKVLSDNELRQQPLAFGTETGTVGDGLALLDANPQAVVDAWPDLSPEARAAVMAIIEAGGRS